MRSREREPDGPVTRASSRGGQRRRHRASGVAGQKPRRRSGEPVPRLEPPVSTECTHGRVAGIYTEFCFTF